MSLPEPLIPAECTMTGNDWFPFYFDRLRKSKWWRRASDVARSRNVMMWGEAFKAVPAGSLQDDDDELAEAAGYGMDVDAFLAVKPEIMAPWVLCSDGRWYHPTVCEVVLDAWAAKQRRAAKIDRRLAMESGLWEELRHQTFERDDYTCQYCGVRGGRLECDHVVPVGRGGPTVLSNLTTACFRCNRSKGSKLLAEWAR